LSLSQKNDAVAKILAADNRTASLPLARGQTPGLRANFCQPNLDRPRLGQPNLGQTAKGQTTLPRALALAPSVFRVLALSLVLSVALVGLPFGAKGQETDNLLPDAILVPGESQGLILVVNKAEQLLFIYRHDGQGNVWLDRILPCSTGMIQGDKLIRGDKKTPEGYYIFNQKLLPQELPDIYGILAYPMDYPNFYDRKIGRGGDGIWAHGINKPLTDYDSEGCIEIQNHDIAALENEIRLRDTPILVYEQVNFVPKDELKKEAEDLEAFVYGWRDAWSSKNIPAYSEYYDTEFYNSDEMSRKAWMDRKTRVVANYKSIQIDISDLRIYRHRDTIIASFTQDYNGDNRFRSLGYKRLYLKGEIGNWKIVAEEYGPLPGTPPAKWLTAAQKNKALTTPPLAVAQLSEPVAAASAGSILPAGPTLIAENRPASSQSQAQAAADEAARAALEQRSNRNDNQSSEVMILASLSQDEPMAVTRDTGVTVTRASADANARVGGRPIPASSTTMEIPTGQAPATPEPATPEPATTSAAATAPASNGPEAQEPAVLVAQAEPAAEPTAPASVEPAGDKPAAVSISEPDRPAVTETAVEAEPEPTEVTSADPPPAEPTGLTQQAAMALLMNWLKAWSGKDEETYFACYASDFLFKDLNLHFNSFKKYRSRRFKEAGSITVQANDINLNLSGDTATVTFLQRYKSDRHEDLGTKTLVLGNRDGQWRIVSEAFQAIPK
jgi:murein L,D-transpeptidase YafK